MTLAAIIPYDGLSLLWLLILMAAGLAMLCCGGKWLTAGSGNLALILNINPVIVGLTVVAIATSMPEFITSFLAARAASPGLAVGNIIGSNIANIGLIMGVAALIWPVRIQRRLIRREAPYLMLVTLIFTGLCQGGLDRVDGAILLAGMAVYLACLAWKGRHPDLLDEKEVAEELPGRISSLGICAFLILLGGVFLAAGADLLVRSATELARRLNISEVLIGITLVAVGTSLPELAAAGAAAMKKQSSLVAGNIVGSNLFNMLFVGGGVSAFYPLKVEGGLFYLEFPAMLLLTLLLLGFCISGKRISRGEGAVFLFLYASIIALSICAQTGVFHF